MIVEVEHIQLNGNRGAPGALEDAEFYIDVAAGLLYVKTDAATYGVPLSAIGLPDLPGDAGVTLVKTLGGADYAALLGGAGGRPFDGLEWRVPGVMPLGVDQATFQAGTIYYALFEMSEARTALKQRVVLGGSAGVTFGVVAWNDGAPGAVLSTATVSGAGVHDATISLDLAPGVYATFFETDTTVSAQVLLGQLRTPRQPPNFPGYPVYLSF